MSVFARNLFLISAFFVCGTVVSAQSSVREAQESLIGTTVTNIRFSAHLQNMPADTAYNGKFKVLEFWATWCRPCLAAVPHLNRMQQRFAGADSLVFLSVTDEGFAKTKKTLERVKFETVVVTDTTRAIHRLLNISYNGTMGLPRTVLVDDHNKIIWYGSPKQLTESLIRKFLARELN